MIRGIHHVGIHTPDLDRLRKFYEDAFDFEIVGKEERLEDYPEAQLVVGMEGTARIVMMRSGSCFIELFEWSSPKGRPLQPLEPHDFGYTHFCVDVSDIDAEYERLSELGMRFVHPSAVKFGENRGSVYGRDPDGNIIEVAELPKGDDLYLDVGDAG